MNGEPNENADKLRVMRYRRENTDVTIAVLDFTSISSSQN